MNIFLYVFKKYKFLNLLVVLLISSMIMPFFSIPVFAGGIESTHGSLAEGAIGENVESSKNPRGGIVVNCYALNVRSGPGLDFPIIGGLSSGCAISIIGREGKWWKIKYNGGAGYVSGNYIDTSTAMVSESESSVSFSGVVRVNTSLNVRNSPWGDIIGSFTDGCAVEVVAKAGHWYKIKYNGGFAYVYDKYIEQSGVTASASASASASNNGSENTSGPALPPPAVASGSDSWKNGFDKCYTMSDSEFTNKDSMSVAEIQSFLERRGSVLSKPTTGGMPSQMIYDACQKYGISPKVILATLQKEQGLVSKKTATQKQLDWAFGVGAYDGGNWNQSYKGFGKQVAGSAQTLRKWYDYAQDKIKKGESIDLKIDGQNVAVKNAATYSNYKYTPHFAGNKLYWDVYRGYFL